MCIYVCVNVCGCVWMWVCVCAVTHLIKSDDAVSLVGGSPLHEDLLLVRTGLDRLHRYCSWDCTHTHTQHTPGCLDQAVLEGGLVSECVCVGGSV